MKYEITINVNASTYVEALTKMKNGDYENINIKKENPLEQENPSKKEANVNSSWNGNVNSSWIGSVTYEDGLTNIFTQSGNKYSYNLPESVFKEFITASSPGSYYNKNIKGKYERLEFNDKLI